MPKVFFENCQILGHQRNTKWELSVHKIAWNHYKIRPKTNLEQIITPMLGPEKTVTPQRANLDQQENMSRRGKREERTKIKRGRKSITAENLQPTKHYKNSGLRQLSRTPRPEPRKQSIFEKAATKIGFRGRDRIHYVYSGFVRFCPTTTNRKSMLGKGGPGKRPVFFFGPRKSYQNPFSEETQFWAKNRVFRRLFVKKPYFYRGILGRAPKIEDKTENDDTRRLVRTALLPRFFCLGKAPCPERLRAPKTISRQTRFDNWSLQGSDETLRKPIFLENPRFPAPLSNAPPAPLSNPWIEKSGPITEAYSILYIYIYIYVVGLRSCPHFWPVLKLKYWAGGIPGHGRVKILSHVYIGLERIFCVFLWYFWSFFCHFLGRFF